MSLKTIVTTVAARDDALRLARGLVQSRLVACAQLHAIESIYRWDGEVQHEPEWRLLLKTTAAQEDAAVEALQAQHPYEVPAILVFDIDSANGTYAAWVSDSVSAVDPTQAS